MRRPEIEIQLRAVAKGGRYDEVGKAFGRSRAATGFSMDLREALSNGDLPVRSGVLAPYLNGDNALEKTIETLRNGGERVVTELPGVTSNAVELGCDRRLVFASGAWQIKLIFDHKV